MSKNLTRKGLALGAVVALGASLLSATPAQAAGELTIQPTVGSVWAVPSTNTFELKASFTAGYSSSEAAKVKFKLDTNGGFALYADGDTAAATATPAAAVALGSTTAVEPSAGGSTTYLQLKVNSASASTTYTASVTAFVDADSDDVIDSGEWTSATQTVSFIKSADINWTVDIVDPVRAETSAVANISSTNINVAQLDTYIASTDTDSQVGAVFSVNGTRAWTEGGSVASNTVADGDVTAVVASYDADYDYLVVTSPTITALAVDDVVKVDVYYEGTPGPAGVASTSTNFDALIGGADGLQGSTNANDAVTATRSEAVASAVVTAVGTLATSATTSNTAISSAAAKVAPDATRLLPNTTVTFATGKTSATVTFTVSENAASSSGLSTIDAAASLVAGGKTLKNANAGKKESFDVAVATDKDGVATLDLALSGLKNGNSFTVKAAAQGYNNTATYTVEDRAANALKNINAVGSNSDSAELIFAKAAAFDLKYVVLDQYGALLTGAGHSVTASDATNSWSASVVGGYATVNVAAYADATTKTFTPTVYKNGVDVSISEPTAEVTIGAANAASSVTATGDSGTSSSSKKALNLKDPKAADTRTGAAAPSVTGSTNVVITGTVKDSSFQGTISSVTLTAAGLLFEADGVWAVGSITVQTAADGTYVADVYSNTAGKKVVTVTAGAATVTEELWFADAADDVATSLTVNAPSIIKAGNTLVVTGKLTDKFGNPVTADGTDEDFNIVYDGPGFAGTIPTATNADGSYRFYVLLGNEATGESKVTVSYDLDEDGDYSDVGDISVTKSVLVGVSATVSAAKKAATSVVKNASGLTVTVVSGTKSVTKVATSDNFKISLTKLTAGKKTVKVYVNDVLVSSKSVTVKK